MIIGYMILILLIKKEIVLKVIYWEIIIYINMESLNIMFKLRLNKKHVVYV